MYIVQTPGDEKKDWVGPKPQDFAHQPRSECWSHYSTKHTCSADASCSVVLQALSRGLRGPMSLHQIRDRASSHQQISELESPVSSLYLGPHPRPGWFPQPRQVASPWTKTSWLWAEATRRELSDAHGGAPQTSCIYPWMDRELTFEWLVIQVGEGLSELRNGEPQGTHKYWSFPAVYGQCIWCFHV